MPNFYEYNPEQGDLLPPSVREVLGEKHLCFFIHQAVERLDWKPFEQGYSEEGHPAYHPVLLLKVWLYAYALGVSSSRRLEQRLREDLAFRYLAAGAQPDYWALNEEQDPNEGAGMEVGREALERLGQRLAEIPARMERLKKAGVQKLSRSDEDSRFLRERKGFVLGYTATVAVSEDHLIVAQQVSQASNDNGLLVPMVEAVERECGEGPGQILADSGFFSQENLEEMERRKMDAYVPDSHLGRELNRGVRVRGHAAARHAAQRRMRSKLRSPAGRAVYQHRKEIVEPVLGVLKEQRGMRRFRLRGLAKVAVEFTLAATALNLTRIWRVAPQLRIIA